ncbi:uncharacterized protein LOC143176940 [Nomia melanderi]|uniref:uncharacterized protein LOC143174314 n=1 Tax=Nomia melanderi TaxID=2448451 RepID=UPI003FCD22FF
MAKTKTTPTQKTAVEGKPSYDELIKMIANLNKTIENLTKQLEEERNRKIAAEQEKGQSRGGNIPAPSTLSTSNPPTEPEGPSGIFQAEENSGVGHWSTVATGKRKSGLPAGPSAPPVKKSSFATKTEAKPPPEQDASSGPITKKAKPAFGNELLIRPILTYGCPIWYNISAGTMEQLRVFERKCLRACLSRYRTPESNFTKLVKNHRLYEEANIIRIDLFILKLIRNHWANVHNVTTNSLIHCSTFPNPLYFRKTMVTGYTPPESFIYLDSEGYIQNSENVPIIYHVHRRTFDKHITYDKNIRFNDPDMRYNYNLSNVDKRDKHRQNIRYWWL